MWILLFACAPVDDAPARDPGADPPRIAVTWSPAGVWQGDLVAFTLTGDGTRWEQGMNVRFYLPDGGEANDVDLAALTVVDATHAVGEIRLSTAARLGARDVLVDGTLVVPDAFNVYDSPPDLTEVYVQTRFDVTRRIDPDTCEVTTSVAASAIFIVPMDPRCGNGPPPTAGPFPYDRNGVFPGPPPQNDEPCPTPETVSAGDVWFEADNAVPLVRRVHPETRTVHYTGEGLTLDDYGFGQTYALVTSGDPDGLGQLRIEGAQPTVPADVIWLGPDLCRRVHDRRDDLPFTWASDGTYPDADIRASLWGTLLAIDRPGFVGAIPWDDGAHVFTSEDLTHLAAGPASFSLEGYIGKEVAELPPGIVLTASPSSRVTTIGELTLR